MVNGLRPFSPREEEPHLSYLYGDSTPSTLQVNYIEFLRDAIDFCVQVLQADQRMVDGVASTRAHEQAKTRDIERVERLSAAVARAVAGALPGDGESTTARCAAAVLSATDDLVRAQIAELRSSLAAEVAKVEAAAAAERESCAKALELLLRKHDLPDTTTSSEVVLTGGARYACRTRLLTAFGLDTTMELEVPAGHLFAEPLRVEKVMEKLEVQAPEIGGWLHKEVKLRPQRLERLYVTELASAGDEATIKLRAAPEGASAGFDVLIRGEAPRVRLVRIDERESAPQLFEAGEADATKLLALHERLAQAAAELFHHRKAVLKVGFDGQPLGTGDRLPVLVERLVAAMAPVVQEIGLRSQATGELVLRRLLGDDRREEIFVSKADLKGKLEPLRENNRVLFDSLWAEGAVVAAPPAQGAVRRPPPPPLPRERLLTPPLGSPLPGPAAAPPMTASATPPATPQASSREEAPGVAEPPLPSR
jgi:hypothetical protein